MTIRFIMIGGFLGAGKTTTLSRLARHYIARGRKVGIVTNDQANDLVDTKNMRAQGLSVEEVPGACFCCRFNDLLETIQRHELQGRPDIILAEPVGSCTDLVATVIQPIRHLYGERFVVAPYLVVFKPSHGQKILANASGGGFSPKAAYIFEKQLEEADGILLNRMDEMATEEVSELQRLIGKRYPGTPLLPISALTGAGFGALTEFLDQDGSFGRKILDLDYDVYAAGEAELGWLNCSVTLQAAKAFDLDAFLVDLVSGLGKELRDRGAEIAHLKAIGLAELAFGTANLVSSDRGPELSLPSRATVKTLELIVNARVAVDPAILEAETRETIAACAEARQATVQYHSVQSFRPGRPEPTHRYATAR
jgi:Ni2+-binding GTPase involved in maturation of urease and hydrogenase